MKFNPNASLDTSQIEDRRGGGGGGGLGGLPVGLPTGGGIVGIIVVIVIYFLTQGGGGNSSNNAPANPGTDLSACKTGADTKQLVCRLTADVNSVQAFWTDALPQQAGVDYVKIKTVLFNGSTQSGCGGASAAMGPFYCPVDKKVYLDTSFYKDMLQRQLGAKGGEFSEAYVLAHEYGHHVQDLIGIMNQVKTRSGPTSDSVRLELQADCYAGIWAHDAATTKDKDGTTFFTAAPSDADIKDAIDAATAVGDDRIQQRTQRHVNEEQWTHGSAAERVGWFTKGYQAGKLSGCDTFRANSL
jgi:predicted metalloprotease